MTEAQDRESLPSRGSRTSEGTRSQQTGPTYDPFFRSKYLPVLVAQRADAETLAKDAEARGWGSEVERHRRLIERLDAHISQAQAG